MKTPTKKNTAREAPKPKATQQKNAPAKGSTAKRDNVLGRRPSKADPLGEQPGTVSHNAQAAEPRPANERARRKEKVTNTDADDAPTGGM